ncbi:hypothetical protein E2C01_003547 [Portunus trituberculatus]|uniref:Uncharacterized protein n=1 Tax=Portunus trituberculatus TaxID=210409 RepID=A0A5B7CTV4_PORTR|nr:hypothetical protein [Portunus trituberculatus]
MESNWAVRLAVVNTLVGVLSCSLVTLSNVHSGVRLTSVSTLLPPCHNSSWGSRLQLGDHRCGAVPSSPLELAGLGLGLPPTSDTAHVGTLVSRPILAELVRAGPCDERPQRRFLRCGAVPSSPPELAELGWGLPPPSVLVHDESLVPPPTALPSCPVWWMWIRNVMCHMYSLYL